ncbi:MAG: hypothetical protein GYB31_01505 [Bacteroidetes bacterium]|nr:hypothetical protein [Bacteroidota bacterium]
MRKATLFLGTTLLESLIRENDFMAGSLALLQLCKGEAALYEAWFSLISLHELKQTVSVGELQDLTSTLKEHNVRLLLHKTPREVDYFAINQKHLNNFQLQNEYELYNLLLYSQSSLEHFVSWSMADTIKHHVRDSLIRDYLSSGYRPYRHVEIHSPNYFLASAEFYAVSREAILAQSQKKSISGFVQNKFVYEQIQNSGLAFLKEHGITCETTTMPDEKVRDQRVPRLPLQSDELEVAIRSYQKEIDAEEIPLLRFKSDTVSFDMDYHLFKIQINSGREWLKNIMEDLIFYRPLKEELDLSKEAYNARKTAALMNHFAKAVKPRLDGEEVFDFPGFSPGDVRWEGTNNFEGALVNSFMDVYQPYLVKREAIDLAEMLMGEKYKNYRLFQTHVEWTSLHHYGEGSVDSRNTLLLLDHEADHAFLILINCYID